MTNRMALLDPQIEEQGTRLKLTTTAKPLKHWCLMEVRWLSDNIRTMRKRARLTRDQHGGYWVNESQPLTASEVVRWYGDALFARGAVEVDYIDQDGLRKLFRLAARQGGAK